MRLSRHPMHYGSRGTGGGRFIIGLIVAVIALASYFSSSEVNPITGKKQYLSLSPNQEIAMGLQAAPSMARRFGGLAQDSTKQKRLQSIGERLILRSVARNTDWHYNFNVLADRKTVNAFALPGGQLFITQALFDKLKSDDQIAAVLAHEISHVIGRHSAQQIAKMELAQGLTSATVIASGDYSTGQMAAMVGKLITMKYGRDDELESDTLGVRIMHEAGYDPHAMIDVMRILSEQGGGARQPEFFSTHPNPDNRIEHIKAAIEKLNATAEPVRL